MKRKKCILCGGALYKEPIYILDKMPSNVQNLPEQDMLNQDHAVTIKIFQCSKCGLVQQNGDPVSYWKDSTRAGERCSSLIELNHEQFSDFIERCNLQGKTILEIGAGKGGFLQTIQELDDYEMVGVGLENNTEFVNNARENGIKMHNGFASGANMIVDGGPFDAFMCLSYPARLVTPNELMECASANIVDGGVGFLRAISLEYITNSDGFLEVTRDLYCYYSKDTFRFLMEKNGFDVLDIWHSMPYICAIVKKREPLDISKYWRQKSAIINKVQQFAHDCTRNGKKMATWCASHYAFTVISVCDIGPYISYIIDNAPFKQGRFSPATHVPIYGANHYFEDPVDTILILGDFYAKEVLQQIRQTIGTDIIVASMNKNGIEYLQHGCSKKEG